MGTARRALILGAGFFSATASGGIQCLPGKATSQLRVAMLRALSDVGGSKDWVGTVQEHSACWDVLAAEMKGPEPARPLLTLAVHVGVPGATEQLRHLARSSLEPDVFVLLSKRSPKDHAAELRRIASQEASRLRAESGLLALETASRYGHQGMAPEPPNLGSLRHPLLVHQFLEVASDPDPGTLADLNAILALSQNGKQLGAKAARLLRSRTSVWLTVLRKEPPEVLFRLLDTLAGVGGPLAVQELLWISDHHKDRVIRGLARTKVETLGQGGSH